MYRITCLLVLKISTDILYLIYSNTNEILFSYIFGALSICLVSMRIILSFYEKVLFVEKKHSS